MKASDPITAHGQTKTAGQWAAEARARGIPLTVTRIGSRMERFGWSAERAVTEPIDQHMARTTRQWIAVARSRRHDDPSAHGLCNVSSCTRKAAPGSGLCAQCDRQSWASEPIERPAWMADPRLLPKGPPGR